MKSTFHKSRYVIALHHSDLSTFVCSPYLYAHRGGYTAAVYSELFQGMELRCDRTKALKTDMVLTAWFYFVHLERLLFTIDWKPTVTEALVSKALKYNQHQMVVPNVLLLYQIGNVHRDSNECKPWYEYNETQIINQIWNERVKGIRKTIRSFEMLYAMQKHYYLGLTKLFWFTFNWHFSGAIQ